MHRICGVGLCMKRLQSLARLWGGDYTEEETLGGNNFFFCFIFIYLLLLRYH